jgi:hypothetical protein
MIYISFFPADPSTEFGGKEFQLAIRGRWLPLPWTVPTEAASGLGVFQEAGAAVGWFHKGKPEAGCPKNEYLRYVLAWFFTWLNQQDSWQQFVGRAQKKKEVNAFISSHVHERMFYIQLRVDLFEKSFSLAIEE